MNRTLALFATAAALVLAALLIGPRLSSPTAAPPPPVHPAPPPPPVATVSGSSNAIALTARLSNSVVPEGSSSVYLTADLVGRAAPNAERSPVDLAVVIDRSGSMAGDKLRYAKQAAESLVEQLTDKDRLAIIQFGSDVVTFPSEPVTAANREAMVSFISRIQDSGGTNIYGALEAAQRELSRHPSEAVRRIILVSDGEPTEGVTDGASIEALARSFHQRGISVSAVGVGTDFNEDLMSGIAENGSGSYGYLRDTRALAGLFNKDLMQATHTVATQVELSFTLPDGVQLAQVLGREARQDGRTVRVSLPDFYAGQLERVVAQLQLTGAQVGQPLQVADVRLSFRDADSDRTGGAEVALQASVSRSEQAVLASRDRKGFLDAVRAQSAENTVKAAKKLRAGEDKEAHALLEKNERLIQQAAEVAGAPAVASDLAEQKQMIATFGAAASAPAAAREDVVKTAKAKARVGFGAIGSTY